MISRSNVNFERDSLINFQKIGYSDSEGKYLTAGGIYSVEVSDIKKTLGFGLGSLINEISPFCNHEFLKPIENSSDYCIIDSYYQRIFRPFELKPAALYGETGINMIDPLTAGNPKQIGEVRVNIKSVPIFFAESYTDILTIKEQVRNSRPDERDIFFRGQNNIHYIRRNKLTNEFLYGIDDVNEINFLTSAGRHKFNYEEYSNVLDIDIQSLLFEDSNLQKHISKVIDNKQTWDDELEYLTFNNRRESIEKGEWSLLLMAIAQHYGVPSFGLDLTKDINVAIWFATNRFIYDASAKKAHFEEIDSNSISETSAVFIFSCLEASCADLGKIDKLLPYSSLRAKNQSGHFLFGGWGAHLNICAQDLDAVMILSPNIRANRSIDYEHLFPNSTNDKLYEKLLSRKKFYSSNHANKFQKLYNWIIEYR